MLGNFSFGDYFKAEAIPWAWEFAHRGARPRRRPHLGHRATSSDDEAEEIWADAVGFPRERIQRLDKDNFWEMGDTGPCGPSSEIFWDFGPEFGPDGGPANPAAEDRYVEIWNLVFPQYFRAADGSLTDLPTQDIDTGAGLERILDRPQRHATRVYDADPLQRLVERGPVGHRSHARRRRPQPTSPCKVLADHARTMTFLVTDGVVPSNEDRGYVLRRIIRRAVRFAYLLGVEQHLSAPPGRAGASTSWATPTPSCAPTRTASPASSSREEDRFRETLKRGSASSTPSWPSCREGRAPGGDVAFDLTTPTASRSRSPRRSPPSWGIDVDEAGFDDGAWPSSAGPVEGGGQDRARPRTRDLDAASRRSSTPTAPPSSSAARRSRPRPRCWPWCPGRTARASVFLDRTPFYAETGGQVGDTGTHHRPTPAGAEVLDTTYGAARPAPPPRPHHRGARSSPARRSTAAIDVERRDAIRRNHTGTHVLHWALREVLGDHVKQQGSLVDPDRLRFDFGHAEALTPDQIQEIEDLANRRDPRQRPGPPLRDHQGRGGQARRHRLLRRQVRRRGPGARGRSPLHRAVRRHPRARRSATSAP